MSEIILVPEGDTDLTNAQYFSGLTDGDIRALEAGGWRKFLPGGSFTMGAPATSTASRLATTDARFSGGTLGGKVAATVVLDGPNIPVNESLGAQMLLDWISGTFEVVIDLRTGKRGIGVTGSNVSGLIWPARQYSGDGALPPSRQDSLVVSMSCDDGAGNSQLRAWVNGGVPVINKTIAATGTFEAGRALDLFPPGFAVAGMERVRVYGGTHAQGFTADGTVAGLTLIDPAADMTADQFNTGTAYFVKSGVDSWTIS